MVCGFGGLISIADRWKESLADMLLRWQYLLSRPVFCQDTPISL